MSANLLDAAPLLDVHAVYVTPLGMRCRVLGFSTGYTWATLRYDHVEALFMRERDFTLSRANWHLLRKVG